MSYILTHCVTLFTELSDISEAWDALGELKV